MKRDRNQKGHLNERWSGKKKKSKGQTEGGDGEILSRFLLEGGGGVGQQGKPATGCIRKTVGGS